ncbi:MAG: protein kinase, partial [Myxococcota bacterium]
MTQYGEGSEVAGRFVIHERIGEGGMGAVFKANQKSLNRIVALKMLHAQNAFTARARRRFAREARAIARLNHPHIAGVYDFGIDDDGQTMWLAMEFVDGVGMTPMKQQDIDLLRLLALVDQILSALSAAHARGIIHRDLKPSNILLSRDLEGREIIKLVDFGLAATQDGDLDLSGAPGLSGDEEDVAERMILGTPRYMAPELFRRAPADPRDDLYALGVILFEILRGAPPYAGDDPRKVMKAHLNKPIPQLIPRDGVEVTVDLERTIYKLLAKDPTERFQSASEVRESVSAMINEFSYVPWMLTGPRNNDASSFHLAGNISTLGFQSGFGGQTIPPSAMLAAQSKLGAAPSPLVGRGQERRVLEQRLRAALTQGQGSVVLLDGEAGVGRSRLAQWVRVRVDEAGVMRAYTGSHSRGSGGFDGVRGVLEQLLGSSDFSYDDLPYAVTKRLQRWDFSEAEAHIIVGLLRPSREDLLWEVGETSAHDQDRIFATVERLLRRVAQDKPVLIVLEDLHDAGDPTIGFLEHLAVGMHLSPAPIVMLATMRSEEIEHHAKLRQTLDRLVRFGSDDIVRMTLDRLDLEEAKELALKMLPLDDAVATRLAGHAEGNPLYLKQILRFLQESGKLVYDSGKWSLAEGVQLTREIPDEVADMMRYRTAQVCRQHSDPEAMRAILERASVLGTRFDYRLLRTMLQLEAGQPWVDELDAVLEAMIRAGVLREVGTSGEDILEFEHGLMREVLLQDLQSHRAQRQLHRLAAQAKTKHWGARADARALELVEHYELAKEPAHVYRYTLKAAQEAHAAGDLKRAMELFKRAGGLNAQLSYPATEGLGLEWSAPVLRGDEVALEVAHLELRLAEYDSVRVSYRKLLNSTDGAVSMWARWGLGELSHRLGEYDEAAGWYEDALRDATTAMQFPGNVDLFEAQRVEASCLFGLGRVVFERGEVKSSMLALSEVLEKAHKLGDKALEADI